MSGTDRITCSEGKPLYLHLPFCVVKCSYCDFFSVVAEGQDLKGTTRALELEISSRAPVAPTSIFVGGGTPSLLPTEDLVHLFEHLERETGFRSSSRETTVECNPESLDLEKARALVASGVNRLSIGLQSLDERILRLFERPHTADQGLAAYEIARRAGVPRVGVDLIYAVPGQELKPWLQELEQVLRLEPDHVSAYSLAFEEETPLTRKMEKGTLERLPEDLELAFFHETRATLERHGYGAYEVSNFARPGERCVHNENYWRNGDYVGLGPSAVSKLGQRRFGSPRSLAAWRRAVEEGRDPTSWDETLSPEARLGETWWLALRTTDGASPREARERAGYEKEYDPTERIADELLDEGWLVRRGERYALADKSWTVADALASRFLTADSSVATPKS